tara:strand:- start:6878 stop:7156 length:279 start_codon:yes stop_codon:yes gene_type:complete
MIFTPITTQAALGTNDAGSSNISSSKIVRLFNSAAAGTEHLVTLNKSDGTDIGTFSLEGHESVIIYKEESDKLFAADAAVLACGVRIVGMHN